MTDFFASPSTVLVKHSLLIEGGYFDESLYNCEDSDLWIRLARLTEFNLVEEPLVFYRIRSNSISNNINYNEAIEMFHKPLFKNKDIIMAHLKLSQVEFDNIIKKSQNKLKRHFE